MIKLTYYTDGRRHLVCTPYSVQNLHFMAENLGIKRCWFHRDHYDIPKRRMQEISARCLIVSSKDIVRIISGEADMTIKAWTDYPFLELGDRSGEEAPVRQITIVSYDRDKLVVVETEDGHREEIKSGYCYRTPGRAGEVEQVPVSQLLNLPLHI